MGVPLIRNSNAGVRFEPDGHRYFYEGREIPGVSHICESVGLSGSRYNTPESAARGQAVHLACELYDLGCLDWDKLSESERGYVTAWAAFVRENNVKILEIERVVVSRDGRWAGRIDRRLEMDRRTFAGDIKSGVPLWWHGIQLAGYAATYPRPFPHRLGIYLKANGRYQPVPYTDRDDYKAWESAVNVVQRKWNAEKR